MASVPMKNLVVGNDVYEVVDDASRTRLDTAESKLNNLSKDDVGLDMVNNNAITMSLSGTTLTITYTEGS